MHSLLEYIRKTGSSQTLKNSYWSLADVVLYPLLMTLLTPLYIRYLGVEQYGIWMLAGNLAQMMNALNMGVGESTIRQVSQNRDPSKHANISVAISNNILVSIALLLLSVGAGTGIALNLHNISFFSLTPGQANEAAYMIVLLTSSVGLRFTELVLLSVFKGFERFDIAAKLSALSRNGTIIGSIVLLLCGYGFIGILWLTLALNVVNILVQLACVKRFYPFIRFRLNFKEQKLSDILHANGWYWLQFVIAMSGFLADRFLVAHYMGISMFGYYSIAAMIGSQIHSVLVTLGTFVFPRVSYLNTQGLSISPMYYKAASAIHGIGWLTTCSLFVCGPLVFKLWLGEATYLQAKDFIDGYLIYQSVMVLAIVPYQFINGTSFLRFNSAFELAMRVLQITLMILFYHLSGGMGIIYALITGSLIIIPLQLMLFAKHVLKTRISQVLILAIPLLTILPLALTPNILLRTGAVLLTGILYYKMVLPHFTGQKKEVVTGA